ncbi:MAG: carbon-nitrogen family hydrolase [Desulfocapsaceae bacterium]|nr:carbon-nitrogen family hydrolase [Desulfocapsaceae bacterium]
MRVAIVQMSVLPGAKSENFAKVEKMVAQTVQTNGNIDLFVLPELWSTGYKLAELSHLASSEGEEEAIFLGDLAARYHTWFAGGSVAAKTKVGIVNRAQIIDRQGQLQACYDKIHLVPMLDEHTYLVAGNTPCVLSIEGITFGFAICYDIRFCELLRKLALEGSEALIVSAEWPLVRLHHWQALLKARAIENQFYVLASNNTSLEGTLFAGHSVGHGPDGTTLCSFEFEEGVRICDIDRQHVHAIRQKIPVFSDRRPDIY